MVSEQVEDKIISVGVIGVPIVVVWVSAPEDTVDSGVQTIHCVKYSVDSSFIQSDGILANWLVLTWIQDRFAV